MNGVNLPSVTLQGHVHNSFPTCDINFTRALDDNIEHVVGSVGRVFFAHLTAYKLQLFSHNIATHTVLDNTGKRRRMREVVPC